MMRVDRMLTLSVMGPLRALVSSADLQPTIPILMYHGIGGQLDDTVHPYLRTVTSTANFTRQIEALLSDGYDAITLSDALGLLRAGDDVQVRRKVVLTFDDGFRDFCSDAFPVLDRAGFKATVFVASSFIGKPFITGRECLRATDIAMLSARGIEFGSHSASHRRLVELSTDDVSNELRDSKAEIEAVTGSAVTTFSFPFRFPEENTAFKRTLRTLLEETGYKVGVTTSIGRSTRLDDPCFLPRLPINDCDDAPFLRAKLAGHYDWVRSGQRVRKQVRALLEGKR